MKKILCLILVLLLSSCEVAQAINAMGSGKTRASITHPKKR